jgi:pyrroloquinoline quinone (PQQ) biosynthesis protein C
MPALSLGSRLSDALSDRRLLTHPFYRRWEGGGLQPAELREYAEQYRHFEAALPGLLAAALEASPSPRARQLLQRNLDDETAQGESHLELFDAFREEVGGRQDAPAGPAMEALLDAYREAASRGATSALAAIATYEVQAADVARTKADSLRSQYGVTARGTLFWDVHSRLDQDHAAWVVEALEELTADEAEVSATAERVAGAWWDFLSERDTRSSAATG